MSSWLWIFVLNEKYIVKKLNWVTVFHASRSTCSFHPTNSYCNASRLNVPVNPQFKQFNPRYIALNFDTRMKFGYLIPCMTPPSSAAYLGSKCQLAFSYVSCVKVSCRPFMYGVTTSFMGSDTRKHIFELRYWHTIIIFLLHRASVESLWPLTVLDCLDLP